MLKRLPLPQNEISVTPSRRSDHLGELYSPKPHSADDNISPDGRRQRRRVGDSDYSLQPNTSSTSALDVTGSPDPLRNNWNDDGLTEDSDDELTGAVGQLSLNEDEQVRYHGKASGLYLLDSKERVDRRNEGGIWLVLAHVC